MELLQIISVSAFMALVVAEVIISSARQVKLYQKDDTVANIVLGAATFFTKVFIKGLYYSVFLFFYQYAPFEVPLEAWWGWAALFLLNDMLFYWFHRLSHETRLFWAFHVAHHNSKHMNFTTSMRGNFSMLFFRFIFWIPLPLLGFDPFAIILCDSIGYFYQLWLHTQVIGKLGPLEWFFNTPSHHRVHHGSNKPYIDKNYGAVFIIWDKLFGTFAPEVEKVQYGLTRNINSSNPINVAFHYFSDIGREMKRTRNWKARLRWLFGRPNAADH